MPSVRKATKAKAPAPCPPPVPVVEQKPVLVYVRDWNAPFH